MTPAATDQKVGWVRDAAGDRFDDLELQALVGFVHVTDDAKRILDGIADAFGCRRSTTRASRRRASSAARTRSSRRSRNGANAGRCRTTSSTTNAIDTFAPIVARLAGK